MMNLIRKYGIFLFIVGSIVTMIVHTIITEPPGYCLAQKRYLSDEEFIQIAVRNNMGAMKIDGSEESIRTFHAKNPQCCTVDRSKTQYFSRFLSIELNGVDVYLNFERKEKTMAEHRGTTDKYYDAWVILDICGDISDNWGISTSISNGSKWAQTR